MDILVINCGSSSVRFALFGTSDWTSRIGGIAEGIGSTDARLAWSARDGAQDSRPGRFADHDTALRAVLELVLQRHDPGAVGHRMVHGGQSFSAPALLDRQRLADEEREIARAVHETIAAQPVTRPSP